MRRRYFSQESMRELYEPEMVQLAGRVEDDVTVEDERGSLFRRGNQVRGDGGDGQRIVTASRDNTARLWRIYPDAASILADAEQSLKALLSRREFAALTER